MDGRHNAEVLLDLTERRAAIGRRDRAIEAILRFSCLDDATAILSRDFLEEQEIKRARTPRREREGAGSVKDV